MPQRYSYAARDEFGKIVKGLMVAEDEIELANKIRDQGYYLTRAILHTERRAKGRVTPLKPKDLLTFTLHLATLIEAGVPLVEGLRDLARNTDDENMQRLIDDIRYKVESGLSLKESLSLYPRTFSPLYLALVGAGEATGKLVFTLESLSAFLEWQMDLKAKIKEAATYPIILAVLLVGVVTLLVVRVVPVFAPMFEETSTELPAITSAILNISSFSVQSWPVVLGGLIAIIFAYIVIQRNPRGKYTIDSVKLKIPIFGQLVHKIIISRFCHVLSLSIASGVNILGAFDISIQAMGNSRLERVAGKARDAVNLGERISTSLAVSKDFPPLVIRMIGVGEETGTLAQSLDRVSKFYDKEIPRTIKAIFAIFEPLMIVLMGVIVGFIAVGVLMPMFTLINSIG